MNAIGKWAFSARMNANFIRSPWQRRPPIFLAAHAPSAARGSLSSAAPALPSRRSSTSRACSCPGRPALARPNGPRRTESDPSFSPPPKAACPVEHQADRARFKLIRELPPSSLLLLLFCFHGTPLLALKGVHQIGSSPITRRLATAASLTVGPKRTRTVAVPSCPPAVKTP